MTIQKIAVTPEMHKLMVRGRIKDFLEIRLPEANGDDYLLAKTIRAQRDINMFVETCGYDWTAEQVIAGSYVKDLYEMIGVAHAYEEGYQEEIMGVN
jgi:hypothetical protein